MEKQQLAVQKKAVKLATALEKACDAVNEFSQACRNAGLPFKGADDSRVLLLQDMIEYMNHLRSVYDKQEAS
ncbi:hypothetical protein [Comamonas jiangduensis]|uniref:hypothetical protein n=1 Tax=Comamonas jiangduensis TaxID=1194168 RepID=UPI003BF793DF